MTPRAIAELIQSKFKPEVAEITEFGDQVSVLVNKTRILEIMSFLRNSSELYFDYLTDLCGVDYQGRKNERFEVVYHLRSILHNHCIRIKAAIPEKDCKIDSVVRIWAGANWHERECFDMYGISFTIHSKAISARLNGRASKRFLKLSRETRNMRSAEPC